jgi:hypothetical protein
LNSCYIEYTKNQFNLNKKLSHNGLQLDIFLYDLKDGVCTTSNMPSEMVDDIFPLKLGKFENEYYPIPFNTHKILADEYGDYSQIPSDSKKYPHEGSVLAHETCPHHPHIYPDLYMDLQEDINTNLTPKILWLFWFGSKNLPNLHKNLIEDIKNNSDVEIRLITYDNIGSYLKFPIHPAVPYLSSKHKADYFRIYFLLLYGGISCNISQINNNFTEYIDKINLDDKISIGGFLEKEDNVSYPPNLEYRKKWYPYLISDSCLISKPNSNYIKEIHQNQHKILDKYYNILIKRPKLGLLPPKTVPVKHDSYPLRLEEILGELNSLIGMKYRKSTLKIEDKKLNKINNSYYENNNEEHIERTPENIWINEGFLQDYVFNINQ